MRAHGGATRIDGSCLFVAQEGVISSLPTDLVSNSALTCEFVLKIIAASWDYTSNNCADLPEKERDRGTLKSTYSLLLAQLSRVGQPRKRNISLNIKPEM